MVIDSALLNQLPAQAKASPRLRQAYDLRTTPEDNSQRILSRWSSEWRAKLAWTIPSRDRGRQSQRNGARDCPSDS